MSNDPTANQHPLGSPRNPYPAATDETEPINNPTTNTTADHDDPPDKDAELARWKQIARKHEDRAKANADAAKELEKLRAASMTETERAVDEARKATRAEVLREVGAERAADAMRLAAAGRPIDIEGALEGLALDRFLTDDGLPDVKRIQAFVDRIAPPQEAPDPRNVRVPLGVRDASNPTSDAGAEFAAFRTRQLDKR